MKLFKIENRGLRFLAGMVAMLIVVTIALVVFWTVGYGAISLNEKFLNWNLKLVLSNPNNVLEVILLGFFLMFAIWVASNTGLLFIKGSKALGNQLFNNSVQAPK